MHWFAYIRDAPQYGKVDNKIADTFNDKIISGSSDIKTEHRKYTEYQLNRHSKTCCFGNIHQCRLAFPMPHTIILETLDVDLEEH